MEDKLTLKQVFVSLVIVMDSSLEAGVRRRDGPSPRRD